MLASPGPHAAAARKAASRAAPEDIVIFAAPRKQGQGTAGPSAGHEQLRVVNVQGKRTDQTADDRVYLCRGRQEQRKTQR